MYFGHFKYINMTYFGHFKYQYLCEIFENGDYSVEYFLSISINFVIFFFTLNS